MKLVLPLVTLNGVDCALATRSLASPHVLRMKLR